MNLNRRMMRFTNCVSFGLLWLFWAMVFLFVVISATVILKAR
jgi:hypothetical protein